MAKIKLEVEVEGLLNSDLDEIKDYLTGEMSLQYDIDEDKVKVTEKSRELDEEDEDEDED